MAHDVGLQRVKFESPSSNARRDRDKKLFLILVLSGLRYRAIPTELALIVGRCVGVQRVMFDFPS